MKAFIFSQDLYYTVFHQCEISFSEQIALILNRDLLQMLRESLINQFPLLRNSTLVCIVYTATGLYHWIRSCQILFAQPMQTIALSILLVLLTHFIYLSSSMRAMHDSFPSGWHYLGSHDCWQARASKRTSSGTVNTRGSSKTRIYLSQTK